ncbi:TIGR02186 family protein [Hwanghaeella sp.]|uniref:TIGR02186 family protein n=1 Tax=Hwanghaeella sp. TaxID=2605943 RepID=UPI003CCB8A29
MISAPCLSRFVLLSAIALALAVAGKARAEPLIADLSDHLVAITTGFTGTELLLFGSIEEDGDVIVVVHGPPTDVTVRRKERVAGIWMNRDSMTFEETPSFYYVAMTQGATEGLPMPVLHRHQIGAQNVRMIPPEGADPAEVENFRTSLIRNQQAHGLYSTVPGTIQKRGQRLFRTSVHFPANVPIGTYVIETLLARNGEIQSGQTTPLFVSKVGAGAQIFRIANAYPALHGILAIVVAMAAGFAANWVFRKLG